MSFNDSAGIGAADDASYAEASLNDVVSLIVEAKLTKHQNLLIRVFVNNKWPFTLLPSYKSVLQQLHLLTCFALKRKVIKLQSLNRALKLNYTLCLMIQLRGNWSNKKMTLSTDPENSVVLIGKCGWVGLMEVQTTVRQTVHGAICRLLSIRY